VCREEKKHEGMKHAEKKRAGSDEVCREEACRDEACMDDACRGESYLHSGECILEDAVGSSSCQLHTQHVSHPLIIYRFYVLFTSSCAPSLYIMKGK
jgi:hypothetical protein